MASSSLLQANSILRDGHVRHYCERLQESHLRAPSVGFHTKKDCSFIHVAPSSKFRPPACLPLILSSFESCYPDSQTERKESILVLMRHGESMWNQKNLFTGCVDVPLTRKGVEEAIEAGKRLSCLPMDIIFTSSLIRAQMTTMLAMAQHRCMKVPIIVDINSEQARLVNEIDSERNMVQSIPVVTAWQLNERRYGKLQGFNKKETAEKYGKDLVHSWRRSYHVQPPGGESLEMCLGRAVAFFKEHIVPQLSCRKHVMVVAHANSLRSIIMHLDQLTPAEVIDLELSTGVPMLYVFREGKFFRRGSLHGSSEPGVYAYTEILAEYKQKLEKTCNDAQGDGIRHSYDP